jgi:branched-chain amino acid transport system substrate-binding protein
MHRPALRIFVLLVAAATFLVACQGGLGSSTASSEMKIAVVGPMSGDASQYGQDFTRGAQLAADKINADGGVNGKKITIATFDDRNDTTEAANVAQKITTDPSVLVAMGHFTSSTVYAAMPIYKANQLPLVVISASDPKITQQGNEWVFRVSPTNDIGSQAVADLIIKQKGLNRVAAAYLNTDFGKAENGYFVERVNANGGEVVLNEAYQPDAKDFTSTISKLKSANPEAVYLSSYYNDAVLLIRQAKAAGVQTQWFASGAIISPGFTEVGGQDVEGVITDRVAQGQLWDQVAAEYKQKYGDAPSPFVVYANSATQTIAEAAKKGSTRTAIRDGLAQIRDLPTGIGNLTFDANRQAVYQHFDFLIVKSGQFQPIQQP